jgi:hypothetical protein
MRFLMLVTAFTAITWVNCQAAGSFMAEAGASGNSDCWFCTLAAKRLNAQHVCE